MTIVFQQKDGLYHSIIGSKYLDLKKDNIYFEITVEKFQDPEFDIVIGFATEKSFNKDQPVGDLPNSIGFHTSQCIVKMANQIKINYGEKYGYNCLYGDTIGIGYRPVDGRIWFTYNGKFLNEMLSTEKNPKKEEEKKDEKKSKKDEKKNEKQLTEEESLFKKFIFKFNQKLEKEIIERDKQLKEEIIQLNLKKEDDVYAVISAKSPVMLTLNFGAKNFMLFQKEIAKGLL